MVKASVFLVLLAVQVAFGGYQVVARYATAHGGVHPLLFSGLRSLGASIVLLGLARTLEGKSFQAPKRAHYVRFILLGLSGVWANQMLLTLGAKLTGATHVSLLQPAVPILTACLAVMLKQERLSLSEWNGRAKLLGFLVTLFGAVWAVVPRSGTHSVPGAEMGRGNMLLVVQIIGGSIYQILNRFIVADYAPITASAWTYVFGCACVWLALLPTLEFSFFTAITPGGWACLAYGIVVASGFCYAAMSWANKQSSPVVVTVMIPLQVVMCGALSWVVLGERMTFTKMCCAGVIALGLLLYAGAKSFEAPRDDDDDDVIIRGPGSPTEGRSTLQEEGHPLLSDTPLEVAVSPRMSREESVSSHYRRMSSDTPTHRESSSLVLDRPVNHECHVESSAGLVSHGHTLRVWSQTSLGV
jgi:drug/metabolite transporter (DMT)-like permease